MKFDNWKEILATSGVILSLLFVGYEINQNNRVARAQIRSDLAALNQEVLILQATNPEYYGLELNDFDELTELEKRRWRFMRTIGLRKQENVFLQYTEGLLDESGLNSYGLSGGSRFQRPEFLEWWNGARDNYDPRFVEFFEDRNGISY